VFLEVRILKELTNGDGVISRFAEPSVVAPSLCVVTRDFQIANVPSRTGRMMACTGPPVPEQFTAEPWPRSAVPPE